MRTSIILVALLFAGYTYAVVTDEIATEKWTNFLAKYNKVYASEEEYQTRFKIFKDNLILNEQRNALEGDEVFGVTKFTDLSPEEFASLYLMKNSERWFPSDKNRAEEGFVEAPLAIPSSWNWSTQGATTPIYNQGQCGSCWAFSATETIESMYFMAGNTLTQLSMQQIVSCDTYDDGCGGGEPMTAYYYVKHAGGIEYYKDYPYNSGNGANGRCSFQSSDIAMNIDGWQYVTKNKNETAMMDYSYSKGPISVCVDASSWSNYQGGIISSGCGTALDHCVQLVGWDTSSAGKDYWIIRNSWGADWGLDGYIYLERDHNVCGVAMEVTAPIVLSSSSEEVISL